jgi:type I restriction-modification system DNA methylase subunit
MMNINNISFDIPLNEKRNFDIVIMNPPYLLISKTTLNYEGFNFKSYVKNGNLVYLFLEKAMKLLNKDGIMSALVLSSWMQNLYGNKIRKYLAQYKVISITKNITYQFKVPGTTHIVIIQKTFDENKEFIPVNNL